MEKQYKIIHPQKSASLEKAPIQEHRKIRKRFWMDNFEGNMVQSINQSINQSLTQSINQSIDRSINQSINHKTYLQLVKHIVYRAN